MCVTLWMLHVSTTVNCRVQMRALLENPRYILTAGAYLPWNWTTLAGRSQDIGESEQVVALGLHLAKFFDAYGFVSK